MSPREPAPASRPLGRLLARADPWNVAAVVLALLVYLPTLRHGFAFDDTPELVANEYVHSLARLPALLTSTTFAGYGWETGLWRPLPQATYALEHALCGLTPWPYHLVNVLLHALVTLLVLGVAREWGLSARAAGVAAILFAIHPLHVEVVANVAGRKDSLAAVFVLATLVAHARAVRDGGGWVALAPLAYALGLLSKESAATALGLVLVQDALALARGQPTPRSRRLRLYGSEAAVLAGFLALRFAVTGHLGLGAAVPFFDNPAASAPASVRLLTAVAVLGKGLALEVAPVALSPDYSYRAIPLVESAPDPRFLGATLALAVTLALVLALRRRAPALLAAVAFYAVALSPVANILFPIGTIFGERLLYLPSVGFAFVAGLAADVAVSFAGPRRAAVLGAVLALALGARTVVYSEDWSDDRTLFRAAATRQPDSTKAHLKLGDAYLERGQPREAVRAFERALEVAPENGKARQNLASALVTLGRFADAEKAYRALLEREPRNADALHGLGCVRRATNDLEGAADLWRRALDARPDHSAALGDLGSYHFSKGELPQARELWERAAAADPANAPTWYNLGLLYESTPEPERAEGAWRRFLETAGPALAAERARVEAKLGRRGP